MAVPQTWLRIDGLGKRIAAQPSRRNAALVKFVTKLRNDFPDNLETKFLAKPPSAQVCGEAAGDGDFVLLQRVLYKGQQALQAAGVVLEKSLRRTYALAPGTPGCIGSGWAQQQSAQEERVVLVWGERCNCPLKRAEHGVPADLHRLTSASARGLCRFGPLCSPLVAVAGAARTHARRRARRCARLGRRGASNLPD